MTKSVLMKIKSYAKGVDTDGLIVSLKKIVEALKSKTNLDDLRMVISNYDKETILDNPEDLILAKTEMGMLD